MSPSASRAIGPQKIASWIKSRNRTRTGGLAQRFGTVLGISVALFQRYQAEGLVRGRFPARSHLDEPGLKPRQRLDEITLSGHDGVNVLVRHRDFVEARRQQRHITLAQEGLNRVP